jgi:hypothetical protein
MVHGRDIVGRIAGIAPVLVLGKLQSLSCNRESTLWPDLAVSAQEIGEGVLLSGILAFILVKVVEVTESRIRLSWLFAFTHTVPIIIAIRLIPWGGSWPLAESRNNSGCKFVSFYSNAMGVANCAIIYPDFGGFGQCFTLRGFRHAFR